MKKQLKNHIFLMLLYMTLFMTMMSCFCVTSDELLQEVAPAMLQPFDLKIVMKAIMDDAYQRNIVDQLPQGFIACYQALEHGDEMLSCDDLAQALSVVFAALMPEMMERTVSVETLADHL